MHHVTAGSESGTQSADSQTAVWQSTPASDDSFGDLDSPKPGPLGLDRWRAESLKWTWSPKTVFDCP